MKKTMHQLREAHRLGRYQLDKDMMFFLNRYRPSDDLKKPTVVIKQGTVVPTEKIYRRGRCLLLKYTDRTGKIWWAWTHASEYEPVRKYRRRDG